jgi:hypothetical protein
MYDLIMLNDQGASEETHHRTLKGVAAQIDTWSDPENMTARVFDGDGKLVYEGPADEFESN